MLKAITNVLWIGIVAIVAINIIAAELQTPEQKEAQQRENVIKNAIVQQRQALEQREQEAKADSQRKEEEAAFACEAATAPSLTALQHQRAYDGNAVAVDKAYLGKLLIVTGTL